MDNGRMKNEKLYWVFSQTYLINEHTMSLPEGQRRFLHNCREIISIIEAAQKSHLLIHGKKIGKMRMFFIIYCARQRTSSLYRLLTLSKMYNQIYTYNSYLKEINELTKLVEKKNQLIELMKKTWLYQKDIKKT